MNEKPNPPKKDIYSYLALLLCFALFVAGVCGIVSSRTASHEYKNSDDVREVSAVVQDYEPIAIKDSDGNTTDWKYEAKLSFDVEGNFPWFLPRSGVVTNVPYQSICTGDFRTKRTFL